MSKANDDVSKPEVESPGRTRSPNYPAFKLETAIAKVRQLYDDHKRFAMPLPTVVGKLGLSPNSSNGSSAIAALRAFGLVELEGPATSRKVAVSEDAAKILANHPDRSKLLKVAALSPKIHAELVRRFLGPEGLPPDDAMKYYLLFDRTEGRFNDDSVGPFLRQFRATLAYAGVSHGESGIAPGPDATSLPVEGTAPAISAGDHVQWTSQGVAQFHTAKRVTNIIADGTYAYVEGSQSAVPIAQLTKVDAATALESGGPPYSAAATGNTAMCDVLLESTQNSKSSPLRPDFRQDIFATDSGPISVHWPQALTAADYADVCDWLNILKRKMHRGIIASRGAESEGN